MTIDMKELIINRLREVSGRDIVFTNMVYDPMTFQPRAGVLVDGIAMKNVVYSPELIADLAYAAHFDTVKPFGEAPDHHVPKFDALEQCVSLLWDAIQEELGE
jgi:hypothetical protein